MTSLLTKIFESKFEGSKEKCNESETSCNLIKIEEKRLDFLNSYRQSILSYISIKNPLQIVASVRTVRETRKDTMRIGSFNEEIDGGCFIQYSL